MKRFLAHERWHERLVDLGVLALFLLFFLFFFRDVLFAGKFLVMSDAFIYSNPLRTIAWNEIRNGRLPLWTPLILSGYPMISMAQIALGYPLTWCYLFLPGYWAEEIYVLAPYLLAPIFTYGYVRETGRSRLAAVLAALSFSYGGFLISAVNHNGMLSNATMWLPLLLIAIERARTRRFAACLLLATGAYAMSVLTGIGQGFLYTGTLAVLYATFLALAPPAKTNGFSNQDRSGSDGWFSWSRWRPLSVCLVAILLSSGIAAFQIFETERAAGRSIRSTISYELFTDSSFTPLQWWKSFIAPIYYMVDTTPWVSPLAFVLAALGATVAMRRLRHDARPLFWLAVAFAAAFLMLGGNTPLYRLIYLVPIWNRFRGPARHGFEWTFAVSVISAYGWDAAQAFFASRTSGGPIRKEHRRIFIIACLILITIILGLLWRRDLGQYPPIINEEFNRLWPHYFSWKIAFTSLTLVLAWQAWRLTHDRWRNSFLVAVIVLVCFVEPAFLWLNGSKPARRFTNPSPATRFLLNYPPSDNRVYTRTTLWLEEHLADQTLDPPNRSMLFGLRNVAGYEPLLLERYSRALGNVSFDSVYPRPGFREDTTLLDGRSHVLDILNTTFVAAYTNLEKEPPFEQEKIKFRVDNIEGSLSPGATLTLNCAGGEYDTLAIVSTLANSADMPQRMEVARVRLLTSAGRLIERGLRAGMDTAEWAHDRPDVAAIIRHSLAPVFDSSPAQESGNIFPAYRYLTQIALGERVEIDRVEITNISEHALMTIWKASLYNSVSGSSIPIPQTYDRDKWLPVYDSDGVLILRNRSVLPPVWLVPEAEAVDGEEALKRIRGEGEHAFDPKRTALIETSSSNLKALTGGPLSSAVSARILKDDPNWLQIETSAETPTVLVVSEMNYPGCEAFVDGAPVAIYTTDYLLRGVIVPGGTHRIEMRYTAPAARSGALISLLSLLVLSGIAVCARRTARRQSSESD